MRYWDKGFIKENTNLQRKDERSDIFSTWIFFKIFFKNWQKNLKFDKILTILYFERLKLVNVTPFAKNIQNSNKNSKISQYYQTFFENFQNLETVIEFGRLKKITKFRKIFLKINLKNVFFNKKKEKLSKNWKIC